MHVPVAAMLIAAAVAAALQGCRTSPHVEQGYGLLIFVCDTTPKPPPRPAEIPNVPVVAGYGSLTGIVFRAATGNGISATVYLAPEDNPTTRSYRSRVTGATGGFAFDSVVPGRYRLRVVAAWEHEESSFVTVAGNRSDTLRFPMPAGMCSSS